MTCRELVDFLMDYLDGWLSDTERACFEEHLAVCPDCVAYLTTYEAAVHIGKSVCRDASEAATAAMPEELVQAILSARRRART